MIDIAKLHRDSGSDKILAKFFATAAYRKMAAYLVSQGVKPEEIVQKRQAHRGAVGIAKVHSLVAMEYLRWVDFDTYANLLEKRLGDT